MTYFLHRDVSALLAIRARISRLAFGPSVNDRERDRRYCACAVGAPLCVVSWLKYIQLVEAVSSLIQQVFFSELKFLFHLDD